MSCTTGAWFTAALLGLILGSAGVFGALFHGSRVLLPHVSPMGTSVATSVKGLLAESNNDVAFAVVLLDQVDIKRSKRSKSAVPSSSPTAGAGAALDTAFRRGDSGLLRSAVENLRSGKELIADAALQQCRRRTTQKQDDNNEQCDVASVSIRSHDYSTVGRGLLVDVESLQAADILARVLNRTKKLPGTVYAVKIHPNSCDSTFTAVTRPFLSKLPFAGRLFRHSIGSQDVELRSWSNSFLLATTRVLWPSVDQYQCVLTTTAYTQQ